GRVSTHCCPADDIHREVRGLMTEEDGLTQALVLVVVGERDQRVFLGDLWSVANAVDRTRSGVDEPAHAGGSTRLNHRLEAVVVDRPAERRIQLEAGIIGDAGEMDDRVVPGAGAGELRGVAAVY